MEPENILETNRSGRQTLMVWGAVAYSQKWPLLHAKQRHIMTPEGAEVIEGKGMNGRRYTQWVLRERLEPYVVKMREDIGGEIFVVEDNAPSHRSNIAKAARLELNIERIIHPPYSPDINPTENLWSSLKRIVSHYTPQAKDLNELWEQIRRAWEEIRIEEVNKTVLSIEGRRLEVEEHNGRITRH